jgi:hypothetical protein
MAMCVPNLGANNTVVEAPMCSDVLIYNILTKESQSAIFLATEMEQPDKWNSFNRSSFQGHIAEGQGQGQAMNGKTQDT